MRPFRSFLRPRRMRKGQTLVEFLLVVVTFFFVLMFGMQWCYISIAKSLLNAGVHAAARVLAVDQDLGKARKTVYAYVKPLVESVDDVTVYITNSPDSFGEAYKVRGSMALKLLPFPITFGLFDDAIRTSPTEHLAYSYSHTPPTRDNLITVNNQPFTLADDEMITVVNKESFGWEWVKYRWVVRAHYSHCGKNRTKYIDSSGQHDNDPWPGGYFEKTQNFPHDREVPAWNSPPSYNMSHSHTSFSAIHMTPNAPTGQPEKFSDGQAIYGPFIYKWTLMITKKGQHVDLGADGQIHLYAWTAMSAD